VDEATVGPVLRICRRWTACRWRSSWPPPGCALSSQQIAARLGDRFRLLAGS
jgi:hypothetical protein